MTRPADLPSDTTLVIERTINAPRTAVWRCWTDPELLKQWYCPKPWAITAAAIDLRPGGRMHVEMGGPDGERIDCPGIFLEVALGRRLTFTDGYGEDYVPRPESFMTGFVEFDDTKDGRTRMVWGARHATTEQAEKHREMGFEPGWNAAADQLDSLAQSVAASAGGFGFSSKARTCLFLAADAHEVASRYVSLVPDSHVEAVYQPDPSKAPLVVEFTLAGVPYMTLNGNPEMLSSNQASISILTEDQDETDRLWNALSADGGEPIACGWLKDRFGVHWQIVPKALPRMLGSLDRDASGRVMAAMMEMVKIDIAGLEAAYRG